MMIRITSKKDGFRRVGRVHTGTRTYPASEFAPVELAALKSDPMLVVDELPDGAIIREDALKAELAAVQKQWA